MVGTTVDRMAEQMELKKVVTLEIQKAAHLVGGKAAQTADQLAVGTVAQSAAV